jgi:hypothetical protein
VKKVLIGITFIFATAICALAQNQKGAIKVTFAVDGETVPCDNFKVELKVGERPIPVSSINQGFFVPPIFGKLYASPQSRRKGNIDVQINCGEYVLDFPGVYPIFVSSGEWKVGIDYPPFRNAETGTGKPPESGLWMSSVEWNIDGCEPCVVSTVIHPDIPPSVIDRLRKDQPAARGERAMDDAYALAVLQVDYKKNRDYLLDLLGVCLAKPNLPPPLEDVCDSNAGLVDYLANLYWRGDSELLTPLMNAADSSSYVMDPVGTFYAELLDRRSADALHVIAGLPVQKQIATCEQAGHDDLSLDPPKMERVEKQLRADGGAAALRCMQTLEATDNHPHAE